MLVIASDNWVFTDWSAASVVAGMCGGEISGNLRVLVRLALNGSAKEVEGLDRQRIRG